MLKKYLLNFLITLIIICLLQAFKVYSFISYIVGYTLGFLFSKYFDRGD